MKVLLKPPQWEVYCCDKRFRVVVAGRRFGKTYLAMLELIRAASTPGRLVWYVAPSYRQAKRILWPALKKMTHGYWACPPNETDLRIELIWGGTICLRGADNYNSLRGNGLDFLVIDEYASIAPAAWTEVLRPALADRLGNALFIGTPQGLNHFHDLVESAETLPDWKIFRFTTAEGGNVPPEELISASQQLDARTFRQEFEARFESLGVGRAYHAFERVQNVRRIGFNPRAPVSWAMDFNMNPLCSVLLQTTAGRVLVLEEMILSDSNTLAACEELLSRTQKWQTGSVLNIYIYGDATGEQRRTSSSRTDWQIVKDFFGRHKDRFQAYFCVPSSNPPVKDRVNCVNAMLRNHAGEQRMFVDQSCKSLIQDFEYVSWKADPHGNTLADLDKSDPKRTHVSDAIGYYVAYEFPMRPMRGEMGGRAIC
jgi:hypothetical protein